MKFECGDLERALANSDLMPEAREHLRSCANCRQEYRLWADISSAARKLHEEWATPGLWPQIRERLTAEQKPAASRWKDWRIWAAAAAAVVISLVAPLLLQRQFTNRTNIRQMSASKASSGEDQDFLTEQALIEVEKNEAAYRKSIEHLAHLAESKLENSASASSVNAREKLLMLDAAIADTRINVASNRFNMRLQATLAELYREKQQTLKELLTSDQNN
jgi:hypothetical protein